MSSANPVPCAVLGAGSFGTCLALLLGEKGYRVDIWARDPKLADAINQRHRNPRYLSSVRLPSGVRATTSLEQALRDEEAVL